jgi:hypothetical protein
MKGGYGYGADDEAGIEAQLRMLEFQSLDKQASMRASTRIDDSFIEPIRV